MMDSDNAIEQDERVDDDATASVSLPNGKARRRVRFVFYDTPEGYPDACIHQLFEDQVEQTPLATALMFGPHRITYRDLNRRANQLAHFLRAHGVTRETVVGVSVERCPDMIVALLGILKAGGGYVPLDHRYPPEHLAFMAKDSGAALILTHARLADRLQGGVPLIFLDDESLVFEGQDEDNLPGVAMLDDLAYIIYTSGSTGRPKGVVGVHRGVVNRVVWTWHTHPFADDEVCCQKTSLSFVDSVSEIFAPLLRGTPTVIIPERDAKDPRRLVETLEAARVTRLVLVPSLLREILALPDDIGQRLSSLRICVSSGEALPIELARRFSECLPDTVLLNLYGSTEVSADVTCYDTGLMPAEAASMPVGRPINNTKIYVVDDTLEPVPNGVTGELYVGGDGLARGYLNRPDLTAERFVRDPFSRQPDARLFRTGDRARRLADGTIEFLGRVDHQVKIRGVRVEIGEVEAALAAHPALRQAVVVPRENREGDTRLFAYVVPIDASAPPAGLRNFCLERLPDHMVPSGFVALESMPLTPSGKVDRHALPAPDPARFIGAGRSIVAPRTPVENQLVSLWEDALGVKGIGVSDDFFALGGHSLLAVQLMTQIERVYGRRLAVSTLCEAPTIERLAETLALPDGARPWSPLIDLQPRGANRPFFLVHGIGGEVMSFSPLAQCLAPDQPVYGVRAKGSDGAQAPLHDVESMAACYLAAIRAVAPEGPYLLGGYSSGAIVALEMAQQLRSQGEEVALLAMIDGEAPESGTRADRWTLSHLTAYLSNLASWVVDDDFFRSKPADQIARVRSKVRLVRARLASRKDAEIDIRDVLGVWKFPDEHRAFLEAHANALATYAAREYLGPITLIRARTLPLASWLPHDLGWGRLAKGGLDIRMIRGAHDNILTEPRVRVLAAHLKDSLAQANQRMASLVWLSLLAC